MNPGAFGANAVRPCRPISISQRRSAGPCPEANTLLDTAASEGVKPQDSRREPSGAEGPHMRVGSRVARQTLAPCLVDELCGAARSIRSV